MSCSLQFDDILNATKAAQALVEKAHKEIERSHIQPVLSLAALDAQIPLSMLRLPSDPASDSSMHRPQRQGSNDDAPSSLTSQALTGCLRSPTTSAREGLRTVSWKSLQLEQVIQEVCAEEKSHRGASADLTKPPSGSLSNTPLHQAGASRAISPFAAAAVPRIPS